jgi:peptidoglycan/LPS O-acetylase OafA/YrhL
VLAVVAFHGGLPVPGGYVGVDVFFVISGFVITAMLLREHESGVRVSLRSFYIRRFRRLTPALAVMVAVTVIVSALLMSPLGSQQLVASTAIGSMFLIANVVISRTTGGYFDALASTNPLLHTWSLSVEEQFYLVFPVLVITAWLWGARYGRPRVGVAAAVAVMTAASLAVALVMSIGITVPLVPESLVGFYGPVGRVWEFGAGALLAVAIMRLPTPGRTASLGLGLAAAALLLISLFGFSELTVFPGKATIVPVVATLILLYIGQSGANPISQILSTRSMVGLGNISYSWYLWHWPIIVFSALLWPGSQLALFGAAVFSLVPAVLSYHFVEQRFRSPAGSTPGRFGALVAVTIVTPVALAATLSIAASNDFWSPRVTEMQKTQQVHVGFQPNCMSFEPKTAGSEDDCVWNAEAEGAPIYLVGDSIAAHYDEALIGASAALDRPLLMVTAAGCPVYHIVLDTPGEKAPVDATKEAGCAPYIDGTLDWLESQPPGLVVMGANDVSWWAPTPIVDSKKMTGDIGDVTALADVSAARVDDKQEALTEGMASTIVRLKDAGHDVSIAQAPPSYRFPPPAWQPTACSVATIVADLCSASASIEEMDRIQGPTRVAVEEAAASAGATVLDLRDYFCPDGKCVTQRDGLRLYFDDIHISVPASKALVPYFTDFIAAQE